MIETTVKRISSLPADDQIILMMILYALSRKQHAVELGRQAFPELREKYNAVLRDSGSRDHYQHLFWPELAEPD